LVADPIVETGIRQRLKTSWPVETTKNLGFVTEEIR